MHFVGPLASLLMTRYGGHLVCMSGAAMAALGLLAASYVDNIPLLILFYSVLTGLGFGLMYIPSIVSCVPYFTKNRLQPPTSMQNFKNLKIILWEQHTLRHYIAMQISCHWHLLVWDRMWNTCYCPHL